VRSVVRILLPLALIFTVALLALGVVNNFNGALDISTPAGGSQSVLALAMIAGRFLLIILVLALAGAFAAQRPGVVTAGTLRIHRPTFVLLVVGVTVIMVGLEYLPALALGPVADGPG
jgi:K+-transporting ATPase ATPase A chain